MERDERVFILGEEVGVWGGTYAVTKGFYDHFGPERVRDTPIAEGVIVGAANGAAMAGLRPVAELMTINFAFLAMDQIVNHSAKLRSMFGGQFTVPIVIRAVGGGGRQLGATHSQTPGCHLRPLPRTEGRRPRHARTTPRACSRRPSAAEDPVLFIEHATLYQARGEVPDGEVPRADRRLEDPAPGRDVTIVTYSKMLQAVAAGGRAAGAGGHRGRDRRPALPAPAGHGAGARVLPQAPTAP